jgi:hypothetical protein
MNIDSLFVQVPKGRRPAPLPADQFEFHIDRATRKVHGGVLGMLGSKEVLRVQTNRTFQIDVNVTLPDTTHQIVRGIDCMARIEGSVPSTPEDARRFLDVALAADFDFTALSSRLLDGAISDYARSIKGAFVHNLRAHNGYEQLQTALIAAFRTASLPVNKVVVAPVFSDVRPTLDLDDAAHSLTLRASNTLETSRVGYKARLVWGDTDEHVASRLTYKGAIEGRVEGAPLKQPLVAGQVQPLELWFRKLLADALSQQEWSAIIAGEEQMNRRVRQAVSQSLGRGTGRVVDTLVMYPVIERDASHAEVSTSFRSRYPITGVKGEGIEVEHAIRFTLVDRDRWQAQGAPDAQASLKQLVSEAARSFLIDKRFEDVIKLFLEGTQGERSFRDGIASRVGPSVKAIGYRLDSVATILTIPEMDFIHGRELQLPERSYGLADPHVQPVMRIEARVRVRQRDGGGALFARALAMFENFEARVLADMEQTVRNRLRNISALSYYSSPYVNGVRTVQDAETGEWHSIAVDDNRLHSDMHAAINTSLAEKYGLEAPEFRLVPGEDRLIERMMQLSRRPITHRIELKFAYGEAETNITFKALATLFIGSIVPESWSSFYHNANRLTLAEHLEIIRETLEDTLKLMESIILNTAPQDLQSVEIKHQIVQLFMRRMSEDLGLSVRLYPLLLTVIRPSASQITTMEIAALKEELRLLYERRATLVDDRTGYRGAETRAQLTQRINEVKSELEEAGRSQEAELQRTQTVRIEQDPRTGRLIDAQVNASPPLLEAR